jgi:hypothetical protein
MTSYRRQTPLYSNLMRREAFIIDLAPSKISVRYTDVYVTRAFRKIGLALLDCLKRAEEVATEYMWTKSGRRDGKTSML